MTEDRDGAPAEVSRRALFGLGISRVLEDGLTAVSVPGGQGRPPAPSPDGDALEAEAREIWGEGDYRPFAEMLRPAAEGLVARFEVGPGHRVLDAGAGDGNLAIAAAAAGAQVVACDVSPEMVEVGAARSAEAGLDIDWRVGDVQALPFETDRFDDVLSSFGAIHAADPRRATEEIRRVTRGGGAVGLTAWSPTGFMGRLLSLAAREGGWPGARSVVRWGRYEDAYRWLGFLDDFDVEEQTLRLGFDSPDAAWALLAEPPGPLAQAVRARPDAAGRLRERLSGLLDEHSIGSGGCEVAAQYVQVSAREPAQLPGRPVLGSSGSPSS